MVLQTPSSTPKEIFYPDSDGQPLANNTEQFDLIVLIKENLEILFAHQDVFIAGDLFWYPIEGNPDIKVAPDILVALGRPKGKRYSYKQWQEGHQPPQVIFEILSPGNTRREMSQKFRFFDRYGAEEYYIYNPDGQKLDVYLRGQTGLAMVPHDGDWTSPRLQIRIVTTGDELQVFTPQGTPFLSPQAIAAYAEQERQRAEQEHQRAEQERQRAEQERQRAEQERQRAETSEKSLQAAIAKLLILGMTQSQIAETLSLPIETVQTLTVDR